LTAVEGTTAVGRPLDLEEIMSRPGAVAGKPEATGATEASRTGFSFGDVIDVINPLQHIPGIAELYRSVTNDRISDDARTAGNMLYGLALGGPVGLGAMMAYTAAGDRMKAAPEADTSGVREVARAAPAAEKTGPPAPDEVPVPPRKPDVAPMAAPGRDEALLGETVAATGLLAGLTAASGRADDTAVPTAATGAAPAVETGASSVSYLDAGSLQDRTAEMVPDADGLSLLATHKSNHLPLDVLRALQERHAERSASERS
jgi:hypothetical protein